jgi:hypothetical protein
MTEPPRQVASSPLSTTNYAGSPRASRTKQMAIHSTPRLSSTRPTRDWDRRRSAITAASFALRPSPCSAYSWIRAATAGPRSEAVVHARSFSRTWAQAKDPIQTCLSTLMKLSPG